MDAHYPNMQIPAHGQANVNPPYSLPSHTYGENKGYTPSYAYAHCHKPAYAHHHHKISTEAILVLYILLVIILRTFHY